MKKQEWSNEFELLSVTTELDSSDLETHSYIHPDQFADAVYEYLKENNNDKS